LNRLIDHTPMNTTHTPVIEHLPSEMACASLGDLRLSKRLGLITEAAIRRPSVGFPRMMGSEAALEGLYRFMNNQRVTPEAILSPHMDGTRKRASENKLTYVVHDSTEFCYKREQPPEDMGYLRQGNRGFLGHFSLAIDPSRAGLPLGLVSMEITNRTGERKGKRPTREVLADPTRESLRWLRGVSASHEQLSSAGHIVHLMDREGDSYELFSHIVGLDDGFVIRIKSNRKILPDEDMGPTHLFDALDDFGVMMERDVRISARAMAKVPRKVRFHPPRATRLAHLEIRAGSVVVNVPRHTSKFGLPEEIRLNAVHVRELDPPDGEAAVDWKLLTTMDASSEEEVAAIVDAYRQRWIIEEYFKALKTGCAFLKRQFDSMPALLNSLAMLAPVAWRLLVLRDYGRSHPDLPATVVLTEVDIAVLSSIMKKPLEPNPTLEAVMWAIASLGGHLKRNGPPGWQTLARGLEDLELMKLGWLAARAGNICDLS